MTTDDSGARLRRYLLGAASVEECDAIEREYFAGADGLNVVRTAEDDLIEDYLSGSLPSGDRDRFERHYLSTPAHRSRVAIVAALRQHAAARPPERAARTPWWTAALAAARGWSPAARMAIAGALLVLIAVGMWRLGPDSTDSSPVVVRTPSADPASAPPPPGAAGAPDPGTASAPPQTAPPPRAPRTVIAVSLAPILVRGTGEPASLAIAAGTDIVRLELQGEAGMPRIQRGRAIVAAVAGGEVWRGPAIEAGGSPAGAIARVDVPAARLRPDDYVVTLFGTDAGGREVELYRYFLRVRRG